MPPPSIYYAICRISNRNNNAAPDKYACGRPEAEFVNGMRLAVGTNVKPEAVGRENPFQEADEFPRKACLVIETK